MKRFQVFIVIFFFAILLLQLSTSEGVGISPASYKEFFEPGLEKTFAFRSFTDDQMGELNLYVKGDLAEYVTLSEESLVGGGAFSATVKLPQAIEKPGVHTILIGVIEVKNDITSTVGGIAAIQGKIDVIVPYPGEYAESTFKINSINEGEEAEFEISSQNLGKSDLQIKSLVEIYKNNFSEKILEEAFEVLGVKPKEVMTTKGVLQTQELSAGEYMARATVDWGKKDIIEKEFRVGEFLVEIVDYDYQFKEGKINPFNIKIQNKWNTEIEDVFASVYITDNGQLVGDFKTVSIDTKPWEIKNITGYFDTTNLESKRYTAKIELSYGGEKTSKLVAIYINSNSNSKIKIYITIAVIVAILIILAFVCLILKIRKLSNKNGKKN